MARLNISIDAFNMDPGAVAEVIGGIISNVGEIETYTQFMTNKITAVSDRFASRNYDRILGALDECKKKLGKAQEEFSDLLASCKDLIEKVNNITN